MNVEELIERLKNFPKDSQVNMEFYNNEEGCNWNEEVVDISFEYGRNGNYITFKGRSA